MNNPAPWPEARTVKVVQMWKDGFSAGQISRVVGVSRNAVIGKLHRIGETQRVKTPRHTAAKPRPRLDPKWTPEAMETAVKLYCDEHRTTDAIGARLGFSRQAVVTRLMQLGVTMRRQIAKSAPDLGPDGDAAAKGADALASSLWAPTGREVGIMELRQNGCRWPIDLADGYGFCGDEKVRGSYCAHHGRASFRTLANGERPDAKVYERAMRRFA